MDIFATQNLAEFAALFGKTVLGKLDGFSESAMRRLAGFFKSFMPRFFIRDIAYAPVKKVDKSYAICYSVDTSITPNKADLS